MIGGRVLDRNNWLRVSRPLFQWFHEIFRSRGWDDYGHALADHPRGVAKNLWLLAAEADTANWEIEL